MLRHEEEPETVYDGFRRFSSLRSSFSKMKNRDGGNKESEVTPPKHDSEETVHKRFSPFGSKIIKRSPVSPSEDVEPLSFRLMRREEPQLKIKLDEEPISNLVKDPRSIAGSIRAKYMKNKITLLFEDRIGDHVDLGAHFQQSCGLIELTI